VPSLLDIAWRAAEAADEKVTQSLLRAREVRWRVHRAENVVGRYLSVKSGDEAFEALLADGSVNLLIVQPAKSLP
jgi:hypothetical protein